MFLREHWFGLSFLLVCGVIVSLFFILQPTPKAPIKIYKPVESLEKPTAEVPEADTSQGGDFQADGTFHGDPHAEVDRPVLPPLQTPEIPKFVKPVPDTQDKTLAELVGEYVPSRAAFEAMSDEQLSELMDESNKKNRELLPKANHAMRKWAKVVGDLTRHAKTRAENDAILAEHADRIKPLEGAMESVRREYYISYLTGNRAFKILQARFLMEHEPQTDAFWKEYWANF